MVLALALILASPPPISNELVPESQSVELQFMLAMPEGALAKARAEIQAEPKAVSFDLLKKYGQPVEVYNKVRSWIASAGLAIPDVENPTRVMILAYGTPSQIQSLLGVRLHLVKGQPPEIHAPDGKPRLPDWAHKVIKGVVGLDNRPGRFPKQVPDQE